MQSRQIPSTPTQNPPAHQPPAIYHHPASQPQPCYSSRSQRQPPYYPPDRYRRSLALMFMYGFFWDVIVEYVCRGVYINRGGHVLSYNPSAARIVLLLQQQQTSHEGTNNMHEQQYPSHIAETIRWIRTILTFPS